ncbi:MAG: hypothetical protein GYA51_13935 [Candidatus Methanofastidiosa archaeon]|nr:hypothetical protein [Candidatus Methanofastidiosa archaeon]
MTRVSLAIYNIRVIDKKTKVPTRLDRLKCGDFYTIIEKFLQQNKLKRTVDQANKKMMEVVDLNTFGRMINGTIKTGEYGYESELVDVHSGQTKYVRSVNDAEMLPFYFLINVEPGYDECQLVLEKFGIFGIKTTFEKALRKYFDSVCKDYVIDISPLSPKQIFFQHIKNGFIRNAQLISFSRVNDSADDILSIDHEETKFDATLLLKAEEPVGLDWLRNLIILWLQKKERKISDIVELKGFDYSQMQIEIQLGKSKKTFNLLDIEDFTPYYDITDNITFNDKGHPIFATIDKEAVSYLKEILNMIYLEKGSKKNDPSA